MNLEIVRKLSENRGGGLKKLAADVGMSEQNLHRCIRNNKIQAADLEKIAFLLKADIRIFFDDEVSRLSNNTVETNGDFSPASMMGNVSVGTDAILVERVKHLEELLAEKERLIKVYEKLVEGKKKNMGGEKYVLLLLYCYVLAVKMTRKALNAIRVYF